VDYWEKEEKAEEVAIKIVKNLCRRNTSEELEFCVADHQGNVYCRSRK
jgi:hypothetical protein